MARSATQGVAGAEIDDEVGAVFAQLIGLADPVDPDHAGEAAGSPGRHTCQGILEDRRLLG